MTFAGIISALCVLHFAHGYVYRFSEVVNSEEQGSSGAVQAAVMLTEGPMYASKQGPFGTDGNSYISAELITTAGVQTDGSRPQTDNLRVWAVFVDETTRSALGFVQVLPGGRSYEHFCCTPALYSDGVCGTGVSVGDVIIHPTLGVRTPTTISLDIHTDASRIGTLNAAYEVVQSGPQAIIYAACDASGGNFELPKLFLDAVVTFRNPYGYIPGQQYGYLPFYGTLFVLYSIFAGVFATLAVLRRKYLIRLQWLVMAVVFAGVVETALYFFTFQSKNSSGIPTPCAICGSASSDYLTAVVWGVIKRTFSRVLLLAVCLGFGVVHATLDRRTTLLIALLGSLYLAFGIADEMVKETTYDVGPSLWEIPVVVLDMIFLIATYSGLNRLRLQLHATGQVAKLGMYTKLFYVLLGNVGAWILMNAVMAAIRFQAMSVAWTWYFLFHAFWDLLYFVILVAVAVIWLPSAEAYQYAWYSQSAGTEAEAEEEEGEEGRGEGSQPVSLNRNKRIVGRDGNLELTSSAGYKKRSGSVELDDFEVTVVPGASFTIEGEDDEEHHAAITAVAAPRSSPTSSPPASARSGSSTSSKLPRLVPPSAKQKQAERDTAHLASTSEAAVDTSSIYMSEKPSED